jgi:hypothetical protein
MATIQRPTKEGSVRTYQEKVGLGFVDILASEMDADLDTIYAAWNGGVDSVTLKDGAVTTPKLVDGAVTTPKLVDGAVTTLKLANPPNGVSTAKLNIGAAVATRTSVNLASAVNLTDTMSTLITLGSVTLRGGIVLFLMPLSGQLELTPAGSTGATLEIAVDSTTVQSIFYTAYGGAAIWVPVNYNFSAMWTASAGAHTILLRGKRTSGTATWQLSAGYFGFMEFA